MSKMISCKSCNAAIASSAKSCPQCGAKSKKPFYKKWWVWAIAVVVIISFAASNGNNENAPSDSGIVAPSTSTLSGSPSGEQQTSNIRIEIPADGIVMFDYDGIMITAQSIKREKNGLITGLDLLIENNSDVEKNVCVWPDAAFGGPIAINGYSMKSTFNEKVAAEKAKKVTLKFDDDTVSLLGFDNLYELIAPFGTYESRDDYMKHEITTYSPSVLSLADFTAAPVGEIVYDEKGVEVYKCGFKKSTFSSDSAIFIIKNGLGADRTLELDSVSINDLMIDSFLNESVGIFNDTYSVVLLSMRYDDGEKYSEDNVNEIEFTLKSKGLNDIISMDTETVGIVTVLY